MTATYPARTQARYRGVVYGIDVLDHTTRQVVRNDYVGQTRQRGRARENQHRDDKPWSDLIVGSARVLWEGLCTDAELDEVERQFIQDVPCRPRLNWKLNEDNPQQIPKWVLERQRHERDDAAGLPRWQPPGERARGSLLEWEPSTPPTRMAVRPRARRARVLQPWQRKAVGYLKTASWWAATWAGSTLAAWLLFLHWHWGGWRQTLTDAVLVLPLAVAGLALLLAFTAKKRTRRKVWRRLLGRSR